MANIRLIGRRIRGVRSTAKITRAMEMIAASKMRRAQESGVAGRPYAEKITQVIAALAALSTDSGELHPCLQCRRQVERITVVHITPDRGLAGGLVSNINRKTATFILEKKLQTNLIAVGRKGLDFLRRTGQKITAEFTGLGDRPTLIDTLPISHIIIDDYSNATTDEVYLAYTGFVNTMVQKPAIERILPVEPASIPTTENVEYIYEPNSVKVLGGLLPRFVEMKVYHHILESIASEQSARMVAMRNATENANELIEDLTLVYNKARQEMITTELLDITGGAVAIE
ncbi:MAG: ATP synthase F1 subunit gamma [Dehalococcoidia bacterium]|nr:MAG: ATP synthase F1 subunit gamma [Dehalococcoidia bacterium]